MTKFRRIARMTFAAPLALGLTMGLAACGDSAPATGEVAESAAIAAIPAPAGKSWAETATISEFDGYVLGNPDAPVKLVEYASFTCGHCADFSEQAAGPLRDKYISSGVVSYEIRNQIHDPFDLVMARLARCGQPESFHPLAEQVWTNLNSVIEGAQANPAALEAAMKLPENQRFVAFAEASGLDDFFAARGLSKDQANSCLSDSASVQAIAERSAKQSEELNVTGTPTFFVNGANVGTIGWPELEAILQRAGAR